MTNVNLRNQGEFSNYAPSNGHNYLEKFVLINAIPDPALDLLEYTSKVLSKEESTRPDVESFELDQNQGILQIVAHHGFVPSYRFASRLWRKTLPPQRVNHRNLVEAPILYVSDECYGDFNLKNEVKQCAEAYLHDQKFQGLFGVNEVRDLTVSTIIGASNVRYVKAPNLQP